MGRAWKSRARAGPGLGPVRALDLRSRAGPGLSPSLEDGLRAGSGFHYVLIFVFNFSKHIQKSVTLIFSIILHIDITLNSSKK